MRNILFVLLASLSFSAFAQNFEQSVYFESGQAQLTKKAKAKLEQLLAQSQEYPDLVLDLKGFCDEVGSLSYNEELARRRAQAVAEYLEAKGLETASFSLTAKGELSKGDWAKNRRVEVRLQVFQPKNWEEFYSFMDQRMKQEFWINPNKDTLIFGANGSQLFIPAGSFVRPNGQAIVDDKVKIELREALSLNDMWMQNLQTVAPGHELIETGGMVNIQAQNLNNETLQLASKASLNLRLPSNQPLNEGMQVFYADRDISQTTEDIVWEASGTKVKSFNFEKDPPTFKFNLLNLDSIRIIAEPPMPKIEHLLSMPKKPGLLAPQEYMELPLVDEKAIRSENPKKRFESDKKHEARIAQLLKKAKERRQRFEKINAGRAKSYAQAQKRQQQALAQYEINLAAYQAQQDSLALLINLAKNKPNEINQWLLDFKWSATFNESLVGLIGNTKQLQRYQAYLKEECQQLGFEEELQTLLQIEEEAKQPAIFLQLATSLKKCIRTNYTFNRNHKLNELREKVMQDLWAIQDQEEEEEVQLVLALNTSETLNGVYRHAHLLNKMIANYNDVLSVTGFNQQTTKVQKTVEQLDEIYQKVIAAKIERGQISPNFQRRYILNSMQVNRLGWINCDRFLKLKEEEKMLAQLKVEQGPKEGSSEKVSTTFSETLGVMQMHYSQGAKSYQTPGYVDRSQKMKITALRFKEGGGLELAQLSAFPDDLAQKKLNYRPISFYELRQLKP
ncbi:outer membrane protein/peptidoglycan-associated (lipo)protein [Saprospira grandis DSM 2844]|uniref:Outer membrane protein/peptidoglycan-associated (Lipo)protein n=1 Tax=Saprospira grandis DSM 2844 TaxID=694433 RepID=J1I7N9_9BACT|nr:OmpA family protein [Saprospira grandis]EJF54830.1 outer membrane protein/peptidoglycan-associated (lipo)protein [Saprospira grandis DSM 2844]